MSDTNAPYPTNFRGLKPEELLARAMHSETRPKERIKQDGVWTPPSVDKVARYFEQYEVLEIIAQGGMGAIYKAKQRTLDRFVALKLLPPEVSTDKNFASRFQREAQALAKLNHPNIIAIYDFGQTSAGHSFIAMEYIDGATLHDWIHGSKLPVDDALHILCEVCEGLACAHSHGVIHRDVKPGNILVDREKRVKVLDFGLARVVEGRADQPQMTITMKGTILGTPDYMSPEQKREMSVDHRADIYSLGVMLYEMLCQKVPQGIFEPASKRAGTDPRLDAIIERAMNSEPAKRFQSTKEMKAAVEAVRAGKKPIVAAAAAAPRATPLPVTPPPEQDGSGLWIKIAAVFLVLLAGAYILNEGRKPAPATAVATPRPVAATPVEVAVATPVVPEKKPAPARGGFLAPATGNTVDILALVDPAADGVSGKWKIVEGALSGEMDGEKQNLALGLPYRPPEEYDFTVEFTVPENGQVMQVFAFPDGQGTWKLSSSWGDKFFNGLDLLDEKNMSQRTEAAVPVTPRLPAGRHTSKVQVRKGRIRALFDEKTILDWQDDLTRLTLEANFKLPDPKQIGVGSWAQSVTFHKIEVHEFAKDEEGEKLRAKVDRTTAAPMPEAAPQSEIAKWLATTDATWQATFQRDVAVPFDTGTAALKAQYFAAIDTSLTNFSKSGKLDEAVAFRDERVRFGLKDGVVAADDGTEPDSIKKLRASYRVAFAKLDKDHNDKAKSLHAKYDQLLAQTQTLLTQRQRLDDALLLKAKRDEIATAWLPAVVAPAPGTAPVKPAATPLPLGAATSATAPGARAAKIPKRELIQKLITLGAGIRIRTAPDTTPVLVDRIVDIPAGEKFDIAFVEFRKDPDADTSFTDADLAIIDQFGEVQGIMLINLPVTDATIERLRGCRELRTLHLATLPQITGANFAALAALPELRTVTLINLPVRDDAVKAICQQRKITSFHIDRVAALTNDGLAAITGLPAIESLSIGLLPQVTAVGWKPISAARKLRSLDLRTARLDAEILAAIGKCTDIEMLSLQGQPLTDSQIAPLSTLTKLRTLSLQGSSITGTAFATWSARTALTALDMSGTTAVSDAGLRGIASAFPRLETFECHAVAGGITVAGAASIAKLRQLRVLYITGDAITDPLLAELARTDVLTTLTLGESTITEAGLAPLTKLSRLIMLGMANPPATDTAIKTYQKLRNLRTFSVGTETPDATTKKLQAALTGVTVRP